MSEDFHQLAMRWATAGRKACAGAWTPQRVMLILEKNVEGYSCSKIAELLGPGFTRCSVIGKLRRMGVQKVAEPRYTRKWGGSKPRPYKIGRRSAPPRSVTMREPVPRRVVPAEAPPSLSLSLFQLRDATDFGPGTCKWAYEDNPPFKFCGHETKDGPYCDYHHGIVYTAPRAYTPRDFTGKGMRFGRAA